MKKNIRYLLCASVILLISGCTYTRFTYPNEPGIYSTVASSDSAAASERKASGMAYRLCQYKGMQARILSIHRTQNVRLRKAVRTQNEYIFIPDNNKDYLTVVEVACIKP